MESQQNESLSRREAQSPKSVDSPTNTLELYKKYLSCLCAVCITCIVLTLSLLIHLIKDNHSESFPVLRAQVLDVKESDLSSCYTLNLYPQSKQPKGSPLILSDLIKLGKYQEAEKLSRVKGVLVDVPSYSGFLTVDEEANSNMFFWFVPKESQAGCKLQLIILY